MIDASLAHAFRRVDPGSTDVHVFERSFPGNALFARKAYEHKWMTSGEWSVYEHVHTSFSDPTDVYVWLNTPPDECFRRIQLR
jgi:tRNA A-37 threonylcarbamoyl transferase component Bud32